MRLQIDKLREREIVIDVAEKADEFPALKEVEERGEGRFLAPVTGQVRAFWANGFVEVQGRIASEVALDCSRCLAPIRMPLSSDFVLTFSRETPTMENEGGEEIELSADEMGIVLFEGDEIDLREALQEQLMLELPLRPLCADGCQGLCPHCGANLNEGVCGCNPPVFNSKFAALKNFKPEKE